MRQEIEHVNSDVLCVGKCWYRFVISLNVCVFRLGLKSFEKDVSGAVMDIQADEEEGMRQATSLKKWYKKAASLSTSFQGSLSPFCPSRRLPRPTEAKDRESLGTRLIHCLGSFQMTSRQLFWRPKIWNSGYVVSQTKSVGVRLFSYVNSFYFSSTFVLLLSFAHVTMNASVTP